ncbi:formyltransferase family protein [Qipengyuania sp. 483]
MKITVLCSDASHPVNEYLSRWNANIAEGFEVEIVRSKKDCAGGDLLFLISCSELIKKEDRAKYRACLVLHASALPQGRGWSPHIWQLLNGAEGITLSMLEAEDKVDSGRIWKQVYIPVPKHALWYEINNLLFEAEVELMNFALDNFDAVVPEQQAMDGISYFPRRTPDDSEIDPFKTIAEQFDLIRVCDPDRFPAYFRFRGHRYLIRLEKQDD